MNNTTCNCRKCNQPLRTEYQTPIMAGKPGYWLVTCDNRECPLFGYTYELGEYRSMNLSAYGVAS